MFLPPSLPPSLWALQCEVLQDVVSAAPLTLHRQLGRHLQAGLPGPEVSSLQRVGGTGGHGQAAMHRHQRRASGGREGEGG